MSEELLTHKDLSVLLGVSETTIKSYRRKFPGSIPVANNGKPIRFKPEAAEICLRIRDLFSTGMSVEEVADRLTEEFSWRRPKGAEPKGQLRKNAGNNAELPQSFATALGNMAKSMISLNQSQASILSAMRKIETLLSDLGLAGKHFDVDAVLDERRKNAAAAQRSLDELNRISAEVGEMLEVSRNGLEEARQIRMEQQSENSRILQCLEALAAELYNLPDSVKTTRGVSSKVVQLRPELSAASSQTAPATHAEGQEVPRHLLHLPLVVRLEDGTYISAGGKTLGRVSLNDVKAMLALSRQMMAGFTLRWEQNADGLWVNLEQARSSGQEGARTFKFMVNEITSSKGLGVLEIRNYAENGSPAHPVEFCRFLTGLGREG